MSRPAEGGINFVIGGRRLGSVPRWLQNVQWQLEHLLSGENPLLPPLDRREDGYRLRSVPADRLNRLVARAGAVVPGRPILYDRHATDLTSGYGAYLARFRAKTRATLLRKEKRFHGEVADASVEHYRSPGEIACFLALAAPLSALTYQERLLDAGLPQGAAAESELRVLAERDRLRAFLLFANGRPVSYLLLPVTDRAVLYQYVGYDPALAELSPGTVLQLAAFRTLFDEPPAPWFDFTEGDGDHKRLFATRSWACATMPLLRRTAANRLLLGSSAAFDGTIERARRASAHLGVSAFVRRALRR